MGCACKRNGGNKVKRKWKRVDTKSAPKTVNNNKTQYNK